MIQTTCLILGQKRAGSRTQQVSRNDFQHEFLDALDVWARQGSRICSLGEGRPDFSTYNMLPVPLSTVLGGPYIGGNRLFGVGRIAWVGTRKKSVPFKKTTA